MASKTVKFYFELFLTFAPIILIVIFGFWFAAQYISPPVPKKIALSTGHKNGGYFQFAQKYREALQKDGIALEIETSSGSLENIRRLNDDKAQAAFIQGGTGNHEENLVSLGSLYFEPVWIFLNTRSKINQINDLQGMRIAVGPEDSGTQSIAGILLQLNDIDQNNARLLPLSNKEAADQLLEDNIDAAFFVASAEAPVVQKLLRDDKVELLSLKRAEAYSHLLPYLSIITLDEGVIDLHQNIPDSNVTMIAPTANLVVRDDLHSALQVLLLGAAKTIHSPPGLFSKADSFPNLQNTAYPVSEIAERYHKVGPPFLMRYLPFRIAIFIDRIIVLLIPLIALVLPLSKIMPPLYRWRIRSSIYRWYRELQDVENTIMTSPMNEREILNQRLELERIEQEVNKIKTPLSYADQAYNLLVHVDLIKKKLAEKPPVTEKEISEKAP